MEILKENWSYRGEDFYYNRDFDQNHEIKLGTATFPGK